VLLLSQVTSTTLKRWKAKVCYCCHRLRRPRWLPHGGATQWRWSAAGLLRYLPARTAACIWLGAWRDKTASQVQRRHAATDLSCNHVLGMDWTSVRNGSSDVLNTQIYILLPTDHTTLQTCSPQYSWARMQFILPFPPISILFCFLIRFPYYHSFQFCYLFLSIYHSFWDLFLSLYHSLWVLLPFAFLFTILFEFYSLSLYHSFWVLFPFPFFLPFILSAIAFSFPITIHFETFSFPFTIHFEFYYLSLYDLFWVLFPFPYHSFWVLFPFPSPFTLCSIPFLKIIDLSAFLRCFQVSCMSLFILHLILMITLPVDCAGLRHDKT